MTKQPTLVHENIFRRGKDSAAVYLTIEPRGTTGVRFHQHHKVHFIVTVGVLAVILPHGERHVLSPGSHIEIEAQEPYSLANTGTIPTEIIEVRTGQYVEDDDTQYLDYPAGIEDRRKHDRSG